MASSTICDLCMEPSTGKKLVDLENLDSKLPTKDYTVAEGLLRVYQRQRQLTFDKSGGKKASICVKCTGSILSICDMMEKFKAKVNPESHIGKIVASAATNAPAAETPATSTGAQVPFPVSDGGNTSGGSDANKGSRRGNYQYEGTNGTRNGDIYDSTIDVQGGNFTMQGNITNSTIEVQGGNLILSQGSITGACTVNVDYGNLTMHNGDITGSVNVTVNGGNVRANGRNY